MTGRGAEMGLAIRDGAADFELPDPGGAGRFDVPVWRSCQAGGGRVGEGALHGRLLAPMAAALPAWKFIG